MASVTSVISRVKQPKGGYLNPNKFNITQLSNTEELFDISLENISSSIVGTTVDYMSRFMNHSNIDKAFFVSRLGARIVGFEDYFQGLLDEIKGLDDKSIFKAVKCASFDSVYRAGIFSYKNVENINANEITIRNIRSMVKRSIFFFEKYGSIISDGFTFGNAYTTTIDSGDGDFLTKNTLWDFKVSKNEPKAIHTLQLIVYYLMGKHSSQKIFKDINSIGIYNPRLNKVYTYEMNLVSIGVLNEIEKEIIGY